MSSDAHILVDREGGVATVTLNRPEKRNALTLEMQADLAAALWEADEDAGVHAVILRGAGRDFCAGYDLAGGGLSSDSGGTADRGDRFRDPGRSYRGYASIDDDAWQLERAQRYRMALFDMHKPVIAEVRGYCLAGGTDLAFLCDMVIAAEDARIGFPPARDLGALPNQMWLYNCGPQWAKRLMLTGDSVTGADAQAIGLVMKAVPAADLRDEVLALAGRLALIDPDLLSANKRIVNLAMELMGARTLQRLAAENDVRGHNTRGADGFRAAVKEKGLKQALKDRDAPFGDGMARVHGPERRDAEGRLLDE